MFSLVNTFAFTECSILPKMEIALSFDYSQYLPMRKKGNIFFNAFSE